MGKPQEPRRAGAIRCAIYTRKSTEEGLDQEFNSLDAQREACAAYIVSQRHEGWTPLPDYYDDGGYSGGNMNRPGLRRLLADVEARKVDVVVIYKIDRLTRALSDFARIVDVLDLAGSSFVSITQSFNTTTSMGRLTLNVLLSFAQFEREVISERVRDKIAASKRKGMWMGGTVPLGYDVVERKLVINPREAETVRHILLSYLEERSVHNLIARLRRDGIRTKVQSLRDGRRRGGIPFSRGGLYGLLENPAYIGQIRHKKVTYPGQHEPIVDRALWDQVQQLLAENGANRRFGTNAVDPSLLAGMLYDGEGRLMTPSHAQKGPRRYRYYVSGASGSETDDRPLRIPAGEIEKLVRSSIAQLLGDGSRLAQVLAPRSKGSPDTSMAIARWLGIAQLVPEMATSELRSLLLERETRVTIEADEVRLSYAPARLLREDPETATGERAEIRLPGILMRRGQEMRLVLTSPDRSPRKPNSRLIALVVKAWAARAALVDRPPLRFPEAQIRKAHLCRTARARYLAPDIVQAIMDGRQPEALTARELLRAKEIPLSWSQQRRLFGFERSV